MKNFRDLEGRYTRSPYKRLKQFMRLLFNKKTYWVFLIGTLIMGYTYSTVLAYIGTVRAEIAPVSPQTVKVTVTSVDIDLSHLGAMGDAIHSASREFDVPVELILGIAKAESSMGTNFYHDYDYNCSNWWGIRKVRDDGSYLRCFNDEEAGARTAAKLIKNRYIDKGLDTPEKMCPVWIGSTYANENCPDWIYNVKNY